MLSVADVVISRDIDILALTEMWLGSIINDHIISMLVPRGNRFHAVSQPGRKCGSGVIVLYKSGLTLKAMSTRGSHSHLEYNDYYIATHGVTFRLCVMYRPPSSKQNGFTNNVFFDQWSTYLDDIMLDTHDIIITGDLNFHLDILTKPDIWRGMT